LKGPYWNSLSDFKTFHNPTALSALTPQIDAVASRSILFIIGPSKPFLEDEVSAVKGFLEAEGTVVLMDDYGSGNMLLEGLKVEARYKGVLLRDPLFRDRDSRLVKVIDFKNSLYLSNVTALAFNCGSVISGVDDSQVLAYSTDFSYLDWDGDGLPDEDEPVGPFPVIVQLDYGNGTIIIISDSSLFINSMLYSEDNIAFLEDLTMYKSVLIDESHWSRSSFTTIKYRLAEVYGWMKAGEVKYPLAAFFIVLIFKVPWRGRMESRDEIKEVLRVHPEWDENLIKTIKNWRNKIGV